VRLTIESSNGNEIVTLTCSRGRRIEDTDLLAPLADTDKHLDPWSGLESSGGSVWESNPPLDPNPDDNSKEKK
jgi:hypothetical protein